MRYETILYFLENATIEDYLLTLFVLGIKAIVIISIIYIALYLKKIHGILNQELSITNKHLAHLDHNNYTDYERDSYRR